MQAICWAVSPVRPTIGQQLHDRHMIVPCSRRAFTVALPQVRVGVCDPAAAASSQYRGPPLSTAGLEHHAPCVRICPCAQQLPHLLAVLCTHSLAKRLG